MTSSSGNAVTVDQILKPAYRPDIDGLRAQAVLLVILFHYHVAAFRGGYAGVDVFFVISGYLITSIIGAELNEGNFSLLKFYERRARRILPALAVVSAATAIAATFWLFPGDLIEFGRSLAATALFASNIFFWSVTGYFATSIWEKPLLHTWSLGVEEQFYLFFPLLLLAVHKYGGGRGKVMAIAILALGSFAAACYGVRHWPDAAFYLLPFRFWELALGGLLASVVHPTWRRDYIYDALALVGIVAIITSSLIFSDKTLFPAWPALLPCGGAALVIFAGARARYGAWLLRTRPMLFTGRISYSLYLWHWPLQVFIQYRFAEAMTSRSWHEWLWRGGAFALSFILAALSWRYVEQPFRQPSAISRRVVFTGAAVALAALALLGRGLVLLRGLPERLPPGAVELAAASADRAPTPFGLCLANSDPARLDPNCLIGDRAAPQVEAVVWGDSHAGAIAPAIDDLLRARGIKGIEFLLTSCLPLAGDVREKGTGTADCRPFNDQVTAYLRIHPAVRYVFLAGRWAPHTARMTFDGTPRDAFYRALAATVSGIAQGGRHVFLIAGTGTAFRRTALLVAPVDVRRGDISLPAAGVGGRRGKTGSRRRGLRPAIRCFGVSSRRHALCRRFLCCHRLWPVPLRRWQPFERAGRALSWTRPAVLFFAGIGWHGDRAKPELIAWKGCVALKGK